MLAALGYSWWTLGALAFACVSSPIQATSTRTAADPSLGCVDYRAEARHSGVGYDHLVHIANQCDKAVKCDVSTNVNPDKLQVVVASKANETVLTWRGSPAREFTAAVSCRLSE
ncbi:MAG TPA: hypothetical protein VFU02_00200 [Polyangiaceae bacterium]|nr:hypothetical protein [Polyangiaceae bacterium]